MRSWRPSAPGALSAALLAFALSGAARAQGLEGQLLLSDGTAIQGELFTRGDMPIRVYALESKQFRRVLLTDVSRIVIRVVKAEQVDEFDWVEMGSDKKIPTGRTFPRKDFEADVLLRTGERVSGHLLGVVYARVGEEVSKFELTRYLRGEAGQSLESLVHVKEISFAEAGSAAACTVTLELGGAGDGASVRLIGSGSAVMREARRTGQGRWSAGNLPPGVYDAVVTSGDVLALGLSAPAEAAGGGPLGEDELKAIRARVAEIENFFTVREAVLVEGSSKAARVLVRMAREEPSTFDSKEKSRFYRFELWTMLKTGERWTVESRAFVTRGRDPRAGESSEPRVRRVDALQGILVSPEKPEALAQADLTEKK